MKWREMLPKYHPLHQEPEPEPQKFAFCETDTAGGGSPWHIRELTGRGKKLGGGADTPALCGRKVSWDLRPDVNELQLRGACVACAQIYRNRTTR
jgi:hypothetical protein